MSNDLLNVWKQLQCCDHACTPVVYNGSVALCSCYHLFYVVFCAFCHTYNTQHCHYVTDDTLYCTKTTNNPVSWKAQPDDASLIVFFNHHSMFYFHIDIKYICCADFFDNVLNNLFVVVAVNILGSDSTPPPVTKMSPVSNKFEGIPQQQRYLRQCQNMLLCYISLKAACVLPLHAVFILIYMSKCSLPSTTSSNTKSTLGPRVLPKLPQKGMEAAVNAWLS